MVFTILHDDSPQRCQIGEITAESSQSQLPKVSRKSQAKSQGKIGADRIRTVLSAPKSIRHSSRQQDINHYVALISLHSLSRPTPTTTTVSKIQKRVQTTDCNKLPFAKRLTREYRKLTLLIPRDQPPIRQLTLSIC